MIGGMNLHGIVRGYIPKVHPDEPILLIQNVGSKNIRGRITALYAPVTEVIAQIQSFTNDDMKVMTEEMRVEHQRKAYLFSDTPYGVIPQTIVRTLERGGDLIKRLNDNSWWLVSGMFEDFSNAGWVSVRIVLQQTVPEEAQRMAEEYEADTP